jgi:hypothetical protein
MQYIFLVILIGYGVLSIRYANSETEKIPQNIRFLFPNKILDIFLFIPASKRIAASRITMGIACLVTAGYMAYAMFI